MRRTVFAASIVLLAACVAACGKDFAELPRADSVAVEVITHPASATYDLTRSITDSGRVAAIRAFVNARRANWSEPFLYPPHTYVVVKFFDTSVHEPSVRDFAAGDRHFVMHQPHESVVFRDATQEEIDEFLRLIGVPRDSTALTRR